MKWREKREPVTVRREVRIVNEQGLHARPAAQFAKQAKRFRSEIWIIKQGQRYSATSLIDILRANVDCGATITVEAHGPDAAEALQQLAEVVRELKDDER